MSVCVCTRSCHLCAHFRELHAFSITNGWCIYARLGIPSLPCVQILGAVYQSRKGSVLCALTLVPRTPLSVMVGVTCACGVCVLSEHSVRVAYVVTVLGTLRASRPCVFMNAHSVAAVHRVSMRALQSFSVHVVALLYPGSVTSPLCPGGQTREAWEASGSPPLLPFPCEGSEMVERWTEAGREQSPQTTNSGPSLHGCSAAGPESCAPALHAKLPEGNPAEADLALPWELLPNSQISLEAGSKLYSATWLLFLV